MSSTWTLISQGQVEDAVALLDGTIPADDSERRMIMDACIRIQKIPDLPEGLRFRLREIRGKLFGATFFDQLRRWVGKRLNADYDLEHGSGYASADEQVLRLAADAVEKGLNADELNWLASPDAENVWLFGRRLGELDTAGAFEAPIEAVTGDDLNCLLFASYLTGRYLADEEAERERVIDGIERSKPQAALGATWRAGPSEAGARRVIRLLENGLVDPSATRALMYGDWLQHLPLKYTIGIVDLILKIGAKSNLEIALGIIDNRLRSKTASIDQFGETAWKAIEAQPASRVSSTFDWQWGRVAEPLASANPTRFAHAFVRLFESDETWLATDSAQHCLRLATTADPVGVWSVIGLALLRQDATGMRLRIRLEHWFGELLPPDVLVDWAKRKGRKGFLLAAGLLTVRSGVPSDSVRLLVREAKNPDEVLSYIFSSLHSGFGAGPLSGLMERSLEPLQNLAKDPEPRIRAWAKAQIINDQKMIKRQRIMEEESECGF